MDGKIKLRTVSNWSIVITVILSLLCVMISIWGFQKYAVLRTAMQDYIAYEKAVAQLQYGSDNLTKQVHLATSTGRQKYIDAYFEEANVTKNREHALDDLRSLGGNMDAVSSLEDGLASSVELMNTEYYAMRLVEEAMGTEMSSWPDEIKDVKLSAEDAALSSSDKLRVAQRMVISPEYEDMKDTISSKISAALNTLTEDISTRQKLAANVFTDVFREIVICVLLFAGMMLLICLIMRFWIVKPLLDYNESIQNGSILPVHGACEIQTLARTYNKIYEENEEREMLMKHQAEHDPMTELLNRGSFDRILKLYEKDENEFALILIDVDNFKNINDTYGHAAGDLILKKVAKLLTNAFRSIDYICRIGGDEFAVIMVQMTSDLCYTITKKIAEVNRLLANPEDGEPAVTLSVGVAFTDRKTEGDSLFNNADCALYYAKEHGRNGCHFYPVK